MSPEQEARLQVVADKQEIRDALMRYARGVDRKDRDLILSAFHEDAVDDHGDAVAPPAQLADFVVKGQQPQMMHFIGNHLAEVEGHRAFSESYFISFMTLEKDGRTYTRSRGGRYLDSWERREGAWKISHRVIVDDWSRLDERVAVAEGLGHHSSQRSREDLIYKLREAALA